MSISDDTLTTEHSKTEFQPKKSARLNSGSAAGTGSSNVSLLGGMDDSSTLVVHSPRVGYACLAQDFRSSLPLFIGDITAILLSWVITLLCCQLVGIGGFPGYRSLIALLATLPIGFIFLQLYPASTFHPAIEISRIFTAVTLIFLGLTAAAIVTGDRPVIALIGRGLHFAFVILCITAFRLSLRSFLSRARWWRQPTLVIGNQSEIKSISEWVERQWFLGIRIVDNPKSDNLWEYPTRAIVTADGAFEVNFDGDIAWQHPRVTFAPEYLEEFPMLMCIATDGAGMAGIQQQNRLCSPIQRILKRVIDLAIIICVAPFWIPVVIMLAIAVKLSSRGPIFYKQKRLGRHSQHFYAWKFRTMMTNADEVLESYLDSNPELRKEWELDHKLKFDPRVTQLGRVLRKTSLDELPQLFNVLAGEMSLVGPRPIVDDEIQKYRAVYRQYERVKPGITGLWQISGRNNTSYEERIRYDDYYIRNWSVWLDFFILFRTVKTVIFREGAY